MVGLTLRVHSCSDKLLDQTDLPREQLIRVSTACDLLNSLEFLLRLEFLSLHSFEANTSVESIIESLPVDDEEGSSLCYGFHDSYFLGLLVGLHHSFNNY